MSIPFLFIYIIFYRVFITIILHNNINLVGEPGIKSHWHEIAETISSEPLRLL